MARLFLVRYLVVLRYHHLGAMVVQVVNLSRYLSQFFPPSSPTGYLARGLGNAFHASVVLYVRQGVHYCCSRRYSVQGVVPLGSRLYSSRCVYLVDDGDYGSLFVTTLNSYYVGVRSRDPSF